MSQLDAVPRGDLLQRVSPLVRPFDRVLQALIEQRGLGRIDRRQGLLGLDAVPEIVDQRPAFLDAELADLAQENGVHESSIQPSDIPGKVLRSVKSLLQACDDTQHRGGDPLHQGRVLVLDAQQMMEMQDLMMKNPYAEEAWVDRFY